MKTIAINSAELVKTIDDNTAAHSLKLHQQKIYPTLAVIVVGQPTGPFVELKKKRAKTLGVELSVYELPTGSTAAEIGETIDWLNEDAETHGVIIQLPLPVKINETELTELLQRVNPLKDVDGLGRGAHEPKVAGNLTALEQQAEESGKYLPTTAWSMLKLVEEYQLLGEESLIIGKGRLVGEPLAKLAKALKMAVKQVDKDDDVNRALFEADLVLSGTDAVAPFIDDRFTKEGANLVAAGQELDHQNLEGYAGAMTPKVGGVGPLTISLLMHNVVRACEQQTGQN